MIRKEIRTFATFSSYKHYTEDLASFDHVNFEETFKDNENQMNQSHYLTTLLKPQKPFKSTCDISLECERNLSFRYGSVSYKQFSESYPQADWLGRKIYAPIGVAIGLILTIYTISKILHVPFSTPPNKSTYLKARTFAILRESQTTLGWLITFFHDRYGQYHVQSGEFHADCYSEFIENYLNAKWYTNYHGKWIKKYNFEHTLKDYQAKSTNEREELLKRFEFDPMNCCPISIDQAISHIDPCLLEEISFADFMVHIDHSLLRFAAPTNEEFLNIKIKDLKKDLTPKEILFIMKRFQLLKPTMHNISIPSGLIAFEDIKLGYLPHLSNTQIHHIFKPLPPFIFQLLENQQIKGLKLSKLSQEQVDAIFEPHIPNYSKMNFEQLFQYSSAENDEKIIEKVNLFEKESILTPFPARVIKVIFKNYLLINNTKNILPKLQEYPKEEVIQALYLGRLNELDSIKQISLKEYFSKEDLKSIPLASLGYTMFCLIAYGPEKNEEEAKEIFGNLPSEEVFLYLSGDQISSEVYKLISDTQLKDMPLSKLPRENLLKILGSEERKKRFAYFSNEEVIKAIKASIVKSRLEMSLLSDDHLNSLPLSEFSEEVIHNLFPYTTDLLINKHRFSCLQTSEVQKTLEQDKLNFYQVHLISHEVIQQLDFLKFPQRVIDLFFPHYSIEAIQAKFAYDKSHLKQQDYENLSSQQKLHNDQLLASLNETQRVSLQSRLYKEQPVGLFVAGVRIVSHSSFSRYLKQNLKSLRDRISGAFNIDTKRINQEKEIASAMQTLGVQKGFSQNDLKNNFKQLVLSTHPDKFKPGENETEESIKIRKAQLNREFLKVKNAYNLLIYKLNNGSI